MPSRAAIRGGRAAAFAALAIVAAGCGLARPEMLPLPLPPVRAGSLPDAGPAMREIAAAAGHAVAADPAAGLALATEDARVEPAPLVLSTSIFPAMAELIAGARSEVDFQTYRWEADSDPARTVVDAIGRLQERRRVDAPDGPPVIVRLLVDAIDERALPYLYLPRVASRLDALGLDPRLVRVELGVHSHAGADSFHGKSLVVDGARAIVTGANAEKKQDFANPWFDLGFRMDGAVAAALRIEFADAWRRGRVWTCGGKMPRRLSAIRGCFREPEPLADLRWPPAGPPAATTPVLVVAKNASQEAEKHAGADPATAALVAMIDSARSTVHVLTPDLNAGGFVDAIRRAIGRGVHVELVTSKGFDQLGEELPLEGGGNASVIEKRLFAPIAGVADPCARLDPRWFSWDGAAPSDGNGPHASHAKYASIDGAVAAIGSANMDTQSWERSRELVVFVGDAEIVGSWDRLAFDPVFARAVPTGRCTAGTPNR